MGLKITKSPYGVQYDLEKILKGRKTPVKASGWVAYDDIYRQGSGEWRECEFEAEVEIYVATRDREGLQRFLNKYTEDRGVRNYRNHDYLDEEDIEEIHHAVIKYHLGKLDERLARIDDLGERGPFVAVKMRNQLLKSAKAEFIRAVRAIHTDQAG